MRSEMVFAAEHTLPNRYMLCRVLATATRKFHKPATRIEDTTDALLRRIAKADAAAPCMKGTTMTDIQEQNVVTTSSNRSNQLVLSMLVTVTVIYMIVSLVLIVHTRKQAAQNQVSQQASDTEAAAETTRNPDPVEHLHRSVGTTVGSWTSMNFNLRSRPSPVTSTGSSENWQKLLQSEVDPQQKQMGQFTGEVSNMRTELGGAKNGHCHNAHRIGINDR